MAGPGPTGGGRWRIGIIGSGIAGSFSAYFAREALGDAAEIVVFERQPYVGGRVRTIEIGGMRVEAGASLIHSSNQYLMRAAEQLGLHFTTSTNGEKALSQQRSELGIWNGKSFDLRTSTADLPLLANLIRRYGLSLWRARREAKASVDRLVRIYDEQQGGVAFATPEELHRKYDLYDPTQVDGYTFFRERAIGDRFVREFSDGIARSNYGQDGQMNAWGTLVSLAGGGLAGGSLFSVCEGNVRICEGLLQAANAEVYTHVDIHEIAPRQPADGARGGYMLTTSDGVQESCDAVVIAAPLEFAEMEFRDVVLAEAARQQRPYQVTHATFVVGQLRPDFFSFPLGSPLPGIILTREDANIPFSSIGALGPTGDGQRTVYKMFSREGVGDAQLGRLFFDITETEQLLWHAYPVLTPTAVWPPFQLGPSLYYVNAMESAVSTMETEAIAARNASNLLARELAARLT